MQAADRTHRIGQTQTVNTMKLLVKDSVEERILNMQESKQRIFENVIDNPAAFGDKPTIEELQKLLEDNV